MLLLDETASYLSLNLQIGQLGLGNLRRMLITVRRPTQKVKWPLGGGHQVELSLAKDLWNLWCRVV